MTVRRQGLLMSPQLLKVVDRASKDPKVGFNSLAHLLNEAALKRVFGRIRKDAGVGVDGVDKEAYAENLGTGGISRAYSTLAIAVAFDPLQAARPEFPLSEESVF
ncbi:MAG: hypothetical protein MJE77_26025 [Proteobacteria bacterium]|nr:hypothetical protein [Pseudomonadota bacterium]